MYKFNEYFKEKKLSEEKDLKEKRTEKFQCESDDAGWNTLEGNQSVVDTYVKWITRKIK
jgi:hypothetical protein